MADDDNVHNILPTGVLGKLPRYDGHSSINKFLKMIEKRSRLDHWNDEQKASIIQYLCTDIAEAYLNSHPELGDATYDDLCRSLIERFKPKLSKTEAYSQLLGLRQNNKTVGEFAGSIESCAAELTDVVTELLDQRAREELLVSVFISGLNFNLKQSLVATEFDEFNKAVKAAKRCERSLDEPRRSVSAVMAQNSAAPRHEQAALPPRHDHDPRRDHTPPTTRGAYGQPWRNRQTNNRQQRSQMACWNCGEEDHFQRDCPQPRPGRGYQQAHRYQRNNNYPSYNSKN